MDNERSRKIYFSEAKRRHDLYFKGCVARSIASVVGHPLTREQEDIRLAQVKNGEIAIRNFYDNAYHGRINFFSRQRKAGKMRSAFLKEIIGMVKTVQKQKDTPAGMVLSHMSVKSGVMRPDQIRESCNGGNDVIVLTKMQAGESHAFHAKPYGKDSDRQFMPVSDNTEDPVILDDRNYNVIVFKPKKRR